MLNYRLYPGEEDKTEIEAGENMCDFRRDFKESFDIRNCTENSQNCFERIPCNVQNVRG